MAAKYTIKLKAKKDVAEGTMAFIFEKPTAFTYKAGQSADFTLINPSETDAEGNTRAFSLTSSPFEEDLMITTRLRDTAFKRVLKSLLIGSALEMEGPFGSFTLHNTATTPAVYLTGGIGITPVHSILKQAAYDNAPHTITVFYSNRRPEDAAFLDELAQVSQQHANLKFIPVMTQPETSQIPWNGEKGHVTGEMLKKYIPDLTTPIYYLSGPASMVTAMRQILTDAGVNEDNIRTEEFPGY